MKRKRIAAVLLALALGLGLCACGAQESRDALTLWYTEGEPLAEALPALAEAYNREKDRALLPISLRAFPDEESLAAAFETGRPDLLLCGHERAFDLYERGRLRDVGAALGEGAPEYPEALLTRSACVGRGFFPLGAELWLLLSRENVEPEELLKRAAEAGKPYLAVEDLAPLLYQLLLNGGKEFHADSALDEREERYRAVYNQLAEAVFTGGLLPEALDGAALVEGGLLPAAVVSSRSLAGRELSGCTLRPLSESAVLAEVSGLAVTARDGRGERSAAAFLRFVFAEGRAEALALKNGLLPLTEAALTEDTPLCRAFRDIRQGWALHLPDGESDYEKNRAAFETALRERLAFLR